MKSVWGHMAWCPTQRCSEQWEGQRLVPGLSETGFVLEHRFYGPLRRLCFYRMTGHGQGGPLSRGCAPG